MAIEFFIPMIIPTTTHQQKKVAVINGKPVYYEPAELKNAREKFKAYLSGKAPAEPMQGAVRLLTKWCFPISGSHRDGEWKTSKPDTDNLVKLLKDVMTDLHFWRDDAQVTSEIIEKFWAARPGLYVYIGELGNGA